MMKPKIQIVLASVIYVLYANATKLELEEMESVKISLLPESDIPLNVSDKDKSILRYGFHRTHDCQEFEKAFICVRKCLDLNYQIAHADKSCTCTCYKNSVLAKYKRPIDTDSTKWKLGAPTTTRPAWAGPLVEKKPKDYEINANIEELTEILNEPGASNEGVTEDPGDVEASGDDANTAANDDSADTTAANNDSADTTAANDDLVDTTATTTMEQ